MSELEIGKPAPVGKGQLITTGNYSAEKMSREQKPDGELGASENKKKQYNKYNTRMKLKGDVEEQGSNVYLYGSNVQGEFFIKATEAIAEYVGKTCGRSMRILMKHGVECGPVEPDAPSEKQSKSNVVMRKYDKEIGHYYNKLDEYLENKAKVFVIIKGQCSLTMKNKVETLPDYEEWERDDNVIGLLGGLKELSSPRLVCSTSTGQQLKLKD